jgi:cytochrome c peroxidase
MRTVLAFVPALAAALLAACSDAPEEGTAVAALQRPAAAGDQLFNRALPHTNGRSCATCHVEDAHTTLKPTNVAARLLADASDPLFDPLDADDPTAATPTYRHLQAGLVRVTLRLPDNVDLIDPFGAVVTGPDRTIAVWRGVPTVENTAMTAPYQLDGRNATLEVQALGALRSHSQITKDPPAALIEKIADYERAEFSSPSAAAVFAAMNGGPPAPAPSFAPGSPEAWGQALFQQGCAPCHGGPTQTKILDPAVTQVLHPELHADGTIDLGTLSNGAVGPAKQRMDQDRNGFLNIGIAFGTYLGQVGLFPNATGVDFPQYRLRFYKDAARTQQDVDLPPAFLDPATGQPFDPPRIGPNLAPQAFTTDPGRCLITGNPVDFEAFDVPQLYGIKDTEPYFHDNSAPDLRAVLDIYSRFILPQLPSLGLPRKVFHDPATHLPPDALTEEEKDALIAYLNQL